MSITKVNNNECIIKCKPCKEVACSYTKVKITPDIHSNIILISGVTGKSIQDITNELLEFAISRTSIQSNDNTLISISEIRGR